MTTHPANDLPKPTINVPRNLAAVLEVLRTLPHLQPAERRDLVWAVRKMGSAFDRSLAVIPSNPSVLSNRLRHLSPVSLGLSNQAFANLKSRLRNALRLAGCYVHPGRHVSELTAEWKALAARCERPSLQYGVSRALHFFSDNGWQPEDIGRAHFDRLLEDLSHSICRNPDATWRAAVRTWNQAVRTVPGWPQSPITIPPKHEPYTLAWPTFPLRLKEDVDRYLQKRAEVDVLDDDDLLGTDEPVRGWAPRTLQDRKFKILQFASALVHKGVPVQELTGLADLIRLDYIKLGLRFFLELAGGQKTPQLSGIAQVLLGIARHGVKAEPETIKQIARIVHNVSIERTGLTAKNRELLRQFRDPRNVAKLLFLPRTIVRSLPPTGPLSPSQAIRLQLALAVEIELNFPVRLHNLATLSLEKSIVHHHPGCWDKVMLIVPGSEVKNGVPLEIELKGDAARLLQLYVTRGLPVLGNSKEGWLFPGENGHKFVRGFGEQLSRFILKETGLRMHTHLFRQIAAKLFLDRNPGQFEVIRLVLGHKSERTTRIFYAEFSSEMAQEIFDEHVVKVRQELVEYADDGGRTPLERPRRRVRREQ